MGYKLDIVAGVVLVDTSYPQDLKILHLSQKVK